MIKIKRYYSALSRYHASNGFGIHSPFAFNFVIRVLRERLPYYCYDALKERRKATIAELKEKGTHPKIISIKTVKLIFRVTNYFNPKQILQIGTNYGVSSTSMLAVRSDSILYLYEPNLNDYIIDDALTRRHPNRIIHFSSFDETISRYNQFLENDVDHQKPYILVNSVSDSDYPEIRKYLFSILDMGGGVIILRNLTRSPLMNKLWGEGKAKAKYGMTFSNEKIAFIVLNPKLPRQDFRLWF
ncbi:MAG: hypothetical protein PHR45_03605 [Muribaculaceae bacterium]|nr:hypothetical protein [Muribaculaceae bacterium]